MTPDERQMLSGLFDRIRNASNGPRDREAESFIADAMRNTPSAAYVLTQTVLVQQQALEAAARRIEELESQGPPAGGQQEGSFLGNLGRSLFGGGQPPPQQRNYDARGYEQPRGPEPPPGYGQRQAYAPPPPQAAPGPWGGGAPAQPQGGGFLQGALQTAAGVAGGVMLGNAIGGLFGGHGGGGGMFGGASALGSGSGAPRETVNNYYESPGQGSSAADTGQDYAQDASYDDSGDYAADDGGGGDDSYT